MANRKQRTTGLQMAIPLALGESVNRLGLSRIMTEKAIRLCCILVRRGIGVQKDPSAFQKLSTSYFEQVFGKSFNKGFFNRMASEGLIECDRSQDQKNGIPFGYRIPPRFFDGRWTTVVYTMPCREDALPVQRTYIHDRDAADRFMNAIEGKDPQRPSGNQSGPLDSSFPYSFSPITSSGYPLPPFISTSSSLHVNTLISKRPSGILRAGHALSSLCSASSDLRSFKDTGSPRAPVPQFPSLHINTLIFPASFVTDDMRTLAYDVRRLREKSDQIVDLIRVDDLLIGEEIEDGSFEVNDLLAKSTYYARKDKAIAHAAANGARLIKDGRRFFIGDPGDYVGAKRKNTAIRYGWCLGMLEQGVFYAARNGTNRRLDHNFTSLPSSLLQVIKEDNGLVEIDMKNAQFAIHARWMQSEGRDKMHGDVSEYCGICGQGILYEHLAEMFSITRREAKTMMLGLAFSSHRHHGLHKKLFGERFPNVLAHIDGFKKAKGRSGLFAVELQLWESELFIDNIFINLKEQGLPCITKHDSVIVRKGDVEAALDIMKGCLQSIGFGCVLNVEGESIQV